MKIRMTSREDYLKAILLLSKEKAEVRAVDLALYLNFSKASVSRAVALLEKEGYLYIQEHGLHLSAKGMAIAEQTYEKYCFFSEQLTAMGIAPELAREDACRLEHAISNESFEKIRQAHSHKTRKGKP